MKLKHLLFVMITLLFTDYVVINKLGERTHREWSYNFFDIQIVPLFNLRSASFKEGLLLMITNILLLGVIALPWLMKSKRFALFLVVFPAGYILSFILLSYPTAKMHTPFFVAWLVAIVWQYVIWRQERTAVAASTGNKATK